MGKDKEIITLKESLASSPLKILPLASNTLIPLLSPLSEAVLEVFSHGCL